jgi:hypothetical protein
MIGSLFYKEWIKLRLWWLLTLAASLAFALILVFRLRHVVELNDSTLVWGAWIDRGYLFFRPFQYAPLVVGVVAAVLQFLPEVQNQRIRLVLHLPLGEDKAVSAHLLAGLVLVSSSALSGYLVFAVGSWAYFPSEYQAVLAGTFLPWFLAGAGAYLYTSALLLETHAWNRTVLLLSGCATLRLFLAETFYGSYNPLLGWLVVWTALLFTLPLYSSLRFRKGLGR